MYRVQISVAHACNERRASKEEVFWKVNMIDRASWEVVRSDGFVGLFWLLARAGGEEGMGARR